MPQAAIGLLAQLASTSMLTWMLLTGSGVLAIALLVLALTPWGHSRPVWKCVILSVVAHILLMGLAYGTRLIWQNPNNLPSSAGDSLAAVQVQWEEASPQPEAVALTEPAWQPSAAPPVVAEPTPRLARPELPPLETVDAGERAMADALPPTEVPADSQAWNPPPEPPDAPQQALPSGAAPQLEMPDALQRPADLLAAPRKTSPETRQLSASDSPRTLRPALPRPRAESPVLELPAESKPQPQEARSTSARPPELPRRIADGQPLPALYQLRAPQQRLQVAQQRGGSVETEKAVAQGLQWLARHQAPDGRWDPRTTGAGREDRVFGHNREGAGIQADSGITGLATLAFLAAGQTHLEGDYPSTVQAALNFLVQQQASNGDLAGDARLFARMYCHSMALLALSEALAMTGDQRLEPAVRRGVAYSVAAQNRNDGGWRYQPGDAGDMSQFGWQVLALHSAELGGIEIPESTTRGMRRFLQQCSSGNHGGLAAYRPRQGPTTTMTAEALLCRFFLEDSLGADTIDEAVSLVSRQRPQPGQVNLYYWYYGTMALYHAGGPAWQRWNEELKATLLGLQITEGPDAGSWPATGMWGGYGGQVYATAVATLSLEVYYRYLPTARELTASAGLGPIPR